MGPRRFGLAPSWQAEYGGSVAKRTAARKAMFDAIDAKAGTSRGWIGCAQFVDWAFTHVAGKAGTIGATEVDLYHVQNYSEGDLLKTLEVACSDKNSREYAGLYEFLLTLFVEVDEAARARSLSTSSTGSLNVLPWCPAPSVWLLLMAPQRSARPSSPAWTTPRLA